MAVAIHASPWSSHWCCLLAWEHSQGKKFLSCGPTLLLMCLPIMVTCLSGRPKLLHNIPLIVIADLFRLFPYLTLPFLGLSSGVWSFSTQSPPPLTRGVSQVGITVWWCQPSMQVILNSLLLSPLRPWSSSSYPGWSPHWWEAFLQGTGIFLPSWFSPSRKGPILIIFFFFLPDYVEVSYLFESLMSSVMLSMCSIWIISLCGCISIVFSMFLWKGGTLLPTPPAILISFSGTFNFFLHSLSHCLNENLFGCSLFHLKKGIGLIWQTRLAPLKLSHALISLITVAYFCFDICFYSIISVISRLPQWMSWILIGTSFLAQFAFLVLLTPLISVEQNQTKTTHIKKFLIIM